LSQTNFGIKQVKGFWLPPIRLPPQTPGLDPALTGNAQAFTETTEWLTSW